MDVDDRRGDVDELPAGATRVRAQHVECLPFVDRMPRHRIPFARSVIARRSDALQILARFCTRLSEVRFLRLASISGQMGLAASAIGRPSISSLDRRPRHDASGTRDRVAVANRRAEAQRAARPDRLVGRRHVRRLRHGRGGHEYGTYARGKPRCADARSRALDRGRPLRVHVHGLVRAHGTRRHVQAPLRFGPTARARRRTRLLRSLDVAGLGDALAIHASLTAALVLPVATSVDEGEPW